MNKIAFALLLLPVILWSQANRNTSANPVRFYYRDKIVSLEIWRGSDKITDSLKTYYSNGKLNEVFYYDDKGHKNSNCFQYNNQGEKLVTWNFLHGKLLSRTDHKLPFGNKETEENTKKNLQLLTELNLKTNYNPTKPGDLYKRGSLRARLANKTLALEDFKKIEYSLNKSIKNTTTVVPDSIIAKREVFKSILYDNLANLYASLEMENYAFQYYYKAITTAPKDNRILYNFTGYLQQKKSNDLALYYFKKIIAEQPEHAHARWGIAKLYSDMGDYEKAMENIEIAFKHEKVIIERTSAYGGRNLRTTRGLLYHKLGESEKGIIDLKMALEMDPNNSYAMKNLGIIYLDQEKYDDACPLFEKAKELNYTLTYDEQDLDALLENACSKRTKSDQAIAAATPDQAIKESTSDQAVVTPKPFVYPNPAKTIITIQNYDFKNFAYEFFDFESNSILRGKSSESTIDVTRLNPGFYILKIFNTTSPQTFKIIKE
jgi:tetratricopeptide (TPR) repeat protein